MRLRLAFAALALGFGVAGSVHAEGMIGIDAVKQGLASGSIVLVDVREPDEFVAGHVPGAINRPLSTFSAAVLPMPTDKTVVVMCRTGRRSTQAQAIAAAGGRRDVVNYAGSMTEWAAKGEPIVGGR